MEPNWIEEFDKTTFKFISEQYGRLFDWFNKDYPEASIRLDVHSDRTKGLLEYKLVVMTGKEATPDNQGLFTNKVILNWNKFHDPVWMQKFVNSIYPIYKKQISVVMNKHYNQEKEISNAK